MLPEAWGHADTGAHPIETDWHPGEAQPPHHGVLQHFKEASCHQMLIAHQVFQASNGRSWNLQSLANSQPVLGGALADQLTSQSKKLPYVPSAAGYIQKARVCGQLGLPYLAEEAPPVQVGVGHHGNMPIRGLVGAAPLREHAGITLAPTVGLADPEARW